MDTILNMLGGSGGGAAAGGAASGLLGGVGGTGSTGPAKHGLTPSQPQGMLSSLMQPIQQTSGLSQGEFQSLLDMSQQEAMRKRDANRQQAYAPPQFGGF